MLKSFNLKVVNSTIQSVVVIMYCAFAVLNVNAKANATAPRKPANQMTTCIFLLILTFRLMFTNALNGNVFAARAIAQITIAKKIIDILH